MTSTRQILVEQDVDTDEAPAGEDVRRWPGRSPSPDSIRRSSISFKPKEPTLSSSVVVVGRTMRTDDWPVPTTRKDGAWMAGRRYLYQLTGGALLSKSHFKQLLHVIFRIYF